MKTYRISRLYRWSMAGAKVILTGLAGVLYLAGRHSPDAAGGEALAAGRHRAFRLAVLCAAAQDAHPDHGDG